MKKNQRKKLVAQIVMDSTNKEIMILEISFTDLNNLGMILNLIQFSFF